VASTIGQTQTTMNMNSMSHGNGRCERDIDVDEWVFVDAELVDREELSDLEIATAIDVLKQSPPAFMEECE
jgi:hypothetical protein